MVFKNIRIKKKGGGTRLQRVEVLPSGKYKFVKNTATKSTKLTKTSKKGNKKTGVRKMAKKRRRSSRKFTIPLAPIIGIVAAPSMSRAIDNAVNDRGIPNILNELKGMAGINYQTNKFDLGLLASNLTPMVAGLLVHKFVGGQPLGLNNILARANVPFIRI